MINWPVPTNIKQLRGFLGITVFYRRFIKNYASISFDLTELLKKYAFHWDSNSQTTFDSLKNAMSQALVFSLPDFTQQFIIHTDSSGSGVGAVLTQYEHPISYFSKKFCPILLNSSTYVKELHAITAAVQSGDTIYWKNNLLSRLTNVV